MEKVLKDINGKTPKEGDLIFYSEEPYSDYADSIYIVVKIKDELSMKCLIVRMMEFAKAYYTEEELYFDFDRDKCQIEEWKSINNMIIEKGDVTPERLEKSKNIFKY